MEIIVNLLPTCVFIDNQDTIVGYGINGKEDKEVQYVQYDNMLFVYNLQCKS